LDLEQLKQILTLVREHELAEFEIEQDGVRIWVRMHAGPASPSIAVPPPAPVVAASAPAAPVVAAPAVSAPSAEQETDEIELAVVKSPIVGTFYRSPEPGATPYVEVGSTVKKGQVLCIIEAMKLMNEIDSEYDGEIVNIYVETGQAVEYGERLFAIRAR
jgi:acetyl-CoA carboxylase biotin carboxyl carrier protein